MSASNRRKTLTNIGLSDSSATKSKARKRKTLDPEEFVSIPFGSNVDIVFGRDPDIEEDEEDSFEPTRRESKLIKLGNSSNSTEEPQSIANSRPVRKAARKSILNRRLSARVSRNTKSNRRNSMAYAVLNKMGQQNSLHLSEDHDKKSDKGNNNQRRLSLPSAYQRQSDGSRKKNPLEDVTGSLLNLRTDRVVSQSLDSAAVSHESLLSRNSRPSSHNSKISSSSISEAPSSSTASVFSNLKSDSSEYSSRDSRSIYNNDDQTSQSSQYSSYSSGLDRLVGNASSTMFQSTEDVTLERMSLATPPESVTPEKSSRVETAPLMQKEKTALQSKKSEEDEGIEFLTRVRGSPLPPLTWADKDLVWKSMCLKESNYERTTSNLDKHPAIHSKMRAILFDWICEVSEVYKLHRETYYLAADLVDRYLLKTSRTPKQQLQLIGITCLFMAAKLEEIYPPKISDFAYVTDGACNEAQITEKEVDVLEVLEWRLSPITPIMWLNTYLQLLQEMVRCKTHQPSLFVIQKFSGQTFIQIARLLDLCILELTSLQFSPSILAASAVSCFFGIDIACRVSSFLADDIIPVKNWMDAFADVVRGLPELGHVKQFRGVLQMDAHNIQTKAVEMESLENAQKLLQEKLEAGIEEERSQQHYHHGCEVSPLTNTSGVSCNNDSPNVLTPPKSDEKIGNDSVNLPPKPIYNEDKLSDCGVLSPL